MKQFLLDYAQWKGFDPMHAEYWKGVTLADLRAYDVPIYYYFLLNVNSKLSFFFFFFPHNISPMYQPLYGH